MTPTDAIPPPQRPDVRQRRLPTFRAILALILREMVTSYGNTPGGYFWAIATPVGGIAVLTVVFAIVSRTPPLGTSFPLFYATGFLPFLLFNSISAASSNALQFSKPLLSYPAVTWVDAIVARCFVAFLTMSVIFVIVIAGTVVVMDVNLVFDPWHALLAWLACGQLGLGVGLFNAYLGGTVPVWDRLWSVITRPLLLISGVIFSPEMLPRWAADILWYNPLVHPIMMMREAFYPTYIGGWISITYSGLVGLTLTIVGLVLLRRYHQIILHG
jgi:capsular polysaccharide transport system permease protein